MKILHCFKILVLSYALFHNSALTAATKRTHKSSVFKTFFKEKKLPLLISSPRRHFGILPTVGFNSTDKFQLGVAFHNVYGSEQKFMYTISPMYAFGSKSLNGIGYVAFEQKIKKKEFIRFALTYSHFGYNQFYSTTYQTNKFLHYHRFTPSVYYEFGGKKKSQIGVSSLLLRSINIWREVENVDSKISMDYYQVNELNYYLKTNKVLHPSTTQLVAQQNQNFIKLSAEHTHKIIFSNKKTSVQLRGYAGYLPINNPMKIDAYKGIVGARGGIALSNNPFVGNIAGVAPHDYTKDETFLDRSGVDKVFSHQVSLTEGGFRSLTRLGLARTWLVSGGVVFSPSKRVPIDFFANVATGDYALYNQTQKVNTAAEFGASLRIIPNRILIHFPILTTSNIIEDQQQIGINRFFQRVSFTLNLNKFRPSSPLKY